MTVDEEANKQDWIVRPDLETQDVLFEGIPSRELYLLEELAQRLYSRDKEDFQRQYSEKERWEIRVEALAGAIFDSAEQHLSEAELHNALDRYRKEKEFLKAKQNPQSELEPITPDI
ncbi:MAG: hypothetical protein ACRBCS_06585 [Cellvibrionaceae bacterium]